MNFIMFLLPIYYYFFTALFLFFTLLINIFKLFSSYFQAKFTLYVFFNTINLDSIFARSNITIQ